MSIRNLWEVTLDVSVLIVFLAVIRKFFKKKLNPNVMYFLWIFVLICILIPIRIEINMEAPDKAPYQEQGTIYNVPLIETVKLPEGIRSFINGMGTANIEPNNMEADGMSPDGMGLSGMNSNSMSLDSMNADSRESALNVSRQQREASLSRLFYTVWGAVAAAFLFYIVFVNIQLYLYVKHNRKSVGRWKGLKVYSLSGYNCLMGILHPAIYVDMEGLGSRELADSVVQHEYHHFKAKDNIWQLLRTICLILQWHNPLVWWAYYASKQDCELACDAGVVGKLSEEARYQYGRCLLTISEHKSRAAEGMLLATSIGESAERLKERIELIMKYQQKRAKVLACLLFCIIGFVSVIAVKVVKADSEPSMKASNENTTEQTAQADNDIIEANTTQVIPLAISIENYYSTNLGDAGNLYHIDENHVLWGCGHNDYGQLGQGTQDYDFHEDMVKIADNVIHVDYSQQGFTIYLTEDGKLYGMGCAATGALQGYESISLEMRLNEYNFTINSPKLLMENVVYARCGNGDVVCLLEDGSVWTWGTVWWQMPKEYFIAEPKKILENAVMITGGWFNHAALLSDGSVWTWGYNYAGNCGIKGEKVVSEPVKVAEDAVMVWTGTTEYNVDCTDISEFDGWYEQGLENTIFLKNDGTYWACGIGIGDEEKLLSPYWEAYEYSVICSDEFMQIQSENEVTDTPKKEDEKSDISTQENIVTIQTFAPKDVKVTPEIVEYDFESACEKGEKQQIYGMLPGASEGIWYIVTVDGVEYYYGKYDHSADRTDLFGYAIVSREHSLANGISVGMTKSEVLELYSAMAMLDTENNILNGVGGHMGWNSTAYPRSPAGMDETLQYVDGKEYCWDNQFDYVMIAEVEQPLDTLPVYVALMMKDDIVSAITFYYPTMG